jgi:hypothetical protein
LHRLRRFSSMQTHYHFCLTYLVLTSVRFIIGLENDLTAPQDANARDDLSETMASDRQPDENREGVTLDRSGSSQRSICCWNREGPFA